MDLEGDTMHKALGPLTRGFRGLTGVELCVETSAALGTRRQVGVRGTANGSALVTNAYPTGRGTHFVPLNAELRSKLGVGLGDVVELEIEPRPEGDYTVPPELLEAIASAPDGEEAWQGLRDAHRRTASDWVASGSTPAARALLASNVVRRALRHSSGGTFWFTDEDYRDIRGG